MGMTSPACSSWAGVDLVRCSFSGARSPHSVQSDPDSDPKGLTTPTCVSRADSASEGLGHPISFSQIRISYPMGLATSAYSSRAGADSVRCRFSGAWLLYAGQLDPKGLTTPACVSRAHSDAVRFRFSGAWSPGSVQSDPDSYPMGLVKMLH